VFSKRQVVTLSLFFLVSIALLGFRLGDAPPRVHAEIRCWKVVSAMTQTGDWLVPRRDGKPYLNKPPLFYWLAALVSKAAGGASYATLRTPSVVAAVGLLALTLFWARSVGGPSLAMASAAALLLMYSFYRYGRLGTFEMTLALFSNAALLTFDRIYWTGRRNLVPLFFLFVLLAFLTKGPPAFLIVGVPIVLFLGFRRELKRAFSGRVIFWLLVTLPLCLVWFLAVLYRVPDAYYRFFSEAVLPLGVKTAKHTASHYRSPFYYFPRIFIIAQPISLLLPLLVWRGWQTRFWREEPRLRFFAWVCAGLFVAFSIFPQKRQYYLLPIFPSLAILLADSALWAIREKDKIHWAWLGVPTFAAGVVTMAAVVPIAFYFHVLLRVGILIVAAVGVVLVALGAGTLRASARRDWVAAGVSVLFAYWILCAVYFGSFAVWRDQFAAGVVDRRPDFDAAHWARMRKSYPFVERAFRMKEYDESRKEKR